jgi:hypothetical protein
MVTNFFDGFRVPRYALQEFLLIYRRTPEIAPYDVTNIA